MRADHCTRIAGKDFTARVRAQFLEFKLKERPAFSSASR